MGETFLFNPPYDQGKEDLDFRGLERHIGHIRDLALQEKRIQILILPLREKESWYTFIQNDVYCSIIKLRNELTFKRGENKNIVGTAKFKNILVFIGLNFKTTHVLNNTIGNFILENSFWHRINTCYTQIDLINNGKTFVKNLKKPLNTWSCIIKC